MTVPVMSPVVFCAKAGDAAKAHCGFAFADDQTGRPPKCEEAADPLLFAPLIEYPGEDQMEFGDHVIQCFLPRMT